MNRTEFLEFIQRGESSGVEFKRDDAHPDSLAKEMSALLNLRGGHILLGVEDDGTVSGLTRHARRVEKWVMEEVLRDCRYIEATELGVPRKIVRCLREHNGTEPDLEEGEDSFTVRMWRERKKA